MGVDADAALDETADAGPLMPVQISAAAGRKGDAVAAKEEFALRDCRQQRREFLVRKDAGSGRWPAKIRLAGDQFPAPHSGAGTARLEQDRAFAAEGLLV